MIIQHMAIIFYRFLKALFVFWKTFLYGNTGQAGVVWRAVDMFGAGNS